MFSAIGIAARKNPDGTVTVKVEIRDDRINRPIGQQTYTGATLQAIKAQVRADLQARRDAETDATLTAAVVGQVIESV